MDDYWPTHLTYLLCLNKFTSKAYVVLINHCVMGVLKILLSWFSGIRMVMSMLFLCGFASYRLVIEEKWVTYFPRNIIHYSLEDSRTQILACDLPNQIQRPQSITYLLNVLNIPWCLIRIFFLKKLQMPSKLIKPKHGFKLENLFPHNLSLVLSVGYKLFLLNIPLTSTSPPCVNITSLV